MSLKTKETTIGNYITKVNEYDIRMKITYKPMIRGEKYVKEIGSHEFVLCRGSKVFASGLKTKDEAITKANSL